MGYTTYFTVSREDDEPFTPEEREALLALDVFEDETNKGKETICMGGLAKWYECFEDMKDFSLKFPGVVFKMHGEGEERGDFWDAYFKDGKGQDCPADILYPIYDETKLT